MAASPARDGSVLVVDDEPSLREVLTIALRRHGLNVQTANGVRAAIEALASATTPPDIVITDLVMPDGSGLEVLAKAKTRARSTEVIVMTAHSTVESAIEAMRGGAYDFVVKPFSPTQMLAQVEKALEKRAIVRENEQLRARVERLEPSDLEFGTSPKMLAVQELLKKVASQRTTLLVTGESGTGKERIARWLHQHSDRAHEPFRVVNCGALPEALMESELFGHVKGSFTGAVANTTGIFRETGRGTLLLDEVGELAPSLQVKLLRVLQERKVRPVGGTVETPVEARIIAATNRDMEADVRAGKFRQDLYYRLNVIRVELPPLRERPDDITRLADRFLKRFATEMGKEVRAFSPESLRTIARYDFPGNVRELENMVERAVALASSSTIGLGDLPAPLSGASGFPMVSPLGTLPSEGLQLDEVVAEFERRIILQALERTRGVRTAAAKLLGVTFRSLRYRLVKLGIDQGDEVESDGPKSSHDPRAE